GGRPEAAEPPGGRSAHLRHRVRESGGKGRYRRGRLGGSIAEGAGGGGPLSRVRRAQWGEERRTGLAGGGGDHPRRRRRTLACRAFVEVEEAGVGHGLGDSTGARRRE